MLEITIFAVCLVGTLNMYEIFSPLRPHAVMARRGIAS